MISLVILDFQFGVSPQLIFADRRGVGPRSCSALDVLAQSYLAGAWQAAGVVHLAVRGREALNICTDLRELMHFDFDFGWCWCWLWF